MRPIRILVVEDDEDFRHLIIQTLELEEDLTIVGLCGPERMLSAQRCRHSRISP